MDIFKELGIPKKYLKETNKKDRFVAIVHKSWLKSLVKHSKLLDFVERCHSDTIPIEDDVPPSWTKLFVQVLRKHDAKVIPLPRMRGSTKDNPPLIFFKLLEYISQANYKNLWKEAHKKYNSGSEYNKESHITLSSYNDVLKEIITRTYGCQIINVCDPNMSIDRSNQFEAHLNLVPCICAVETLNAIFLLYVPCFDHTVNDCLNFSPAVLEKCYTKPLFVVYQLLNILKSLHDRCLTLGEITLNDIYINEDIWVYVFPQLTSNIYVKDLPKESHLANDCLTKGHKIDYSVKKCEYCGIKTYDKFQSKNESLENLCQLWMHGNISNFTYLTALNELSGRKLGDPNCHHVFPWVTDFGSPCGKKWRDLRKSKYRLNKGDRQLDLTFDHSQTQVPHHVSDVLSSITYYVYKARRTPKSILCKNVRSVWVPAEYPNSIQRLQEWTPDECIPEFFSDPSVFRSIHDDLDDLEVPPWCSSPEDFVEKHREILESQHVSERLHHWIDLTFGYKLGGNAAVKAKNVCLHLADDHTNLMKSGIVQLFSQPHPSRNVNSMFWSKVPPKLFINRIIKEKTRDRSNSSCTVGSKSDEDINIDEPAISCSSGKSPLALSKLLSRSRTSLSEDLNQKGARSSSTQRSTSLGPKNPTFTSHLSSKNKNNGTITLPKEYKPEAMLDALEKKHQFFSKTFHADERKSILGTVNDFLAGENLLDDDRIPNSFTNFVFAESYETKVEKNKATKSLTFPLDNQKISYTRVHCGSSQYAQKHENQILCNYADIVSSRRIRELQVLGCVILELFLHRKLRTLSSDHLSFVDRLKNCITVMRSCKNEIPSCIYSVVKLLLQPETSNLRDFKYPSVTELGLPPPSAHLLLEPLLHCIIPFSEHFKNLYRLISNLKEFQTVSEELEILYHFDCDGHMCSDFENLERAKILFIQNIAECKVKMCVRDLDCLLEEVNTTIDYEIINIVLPHIKYLIEDPATSVLAAWYLFDPISRILGPQKTAKYILDSILKLYENEPNENTLPFIGKIAKLYHHSFLLRLIVRLGLKCFLDNFTAPLVEAIGGYKDYEKVDFILHTHSEKICKKMSHLKTMDTEQIEASPSDDSSISSEKQVTVNRKEKRETKKHEPEPEVFDFDEEGDNESQLKSLIEHLELNIASDLPFNHATAEEALDATIPENIDQLRSIEFNLGLNDDYSDNKSDESPTIAVPPNSYQVELNNITCEVGSKKSESDSMFDKKSIDSPSSSYYDSKKVFSTSSSSTNSKKSRRQEVKISEMSSDSLIWLSHRLGPVLTARYLSRNLLKMLTLCYVGKENLAPVSKDSVGDDNELISVTSCKVIGDENAAKVLDCLASIAGLYGEELILFQYIPHMSELIALCKRKLTANLEGGLISCLCLLKHIIPYLSDPTLIDQLQDVILKSIIHPTVRLMGSTKYTFPSGSVARNVLARKYLDVLYVLGVRIGAEMTRSQLAVPALQRFFLIFDKVHFMGDNNYLKYLEGVSKLEKDVARSNDSAQYVEIMEDGSTKEWSVGGKTIQITPLHLKDNESVDSLSPPVSMQTHTTSEEKNILNFAFEELQSAFNLELAYTAYLPFLKFIGQASLEISLKNNDHVKELCQKYEQDLKTNYPNNLSPKLHLSDFNKLSPINRSNSVGSNISLTGNRIEVQVDSDYQPDLLTLVSNKIENNTRHLHGNWLAYWEHEIGRSDKDTMFNFKQIKLQTFAGHTHGVKCLYVLDNENSFMSGSRDKTVKLWSLRSQGDGTSVSNCQWTYTAHKKSILGISFIESMRLVASCDSVVHIWDPFMGANVCNLESPRYAPVNVLKTMPSPSTVLFAATTEGTIKAIDSRLCSYIYELKISTNVAGLIRCLAIAPSGNWIAAGQASGNITVLDTRTGLVISNWRSHESEVLQLVPVDNDTLVSSSLDQTISVWNVQDGKFKFHLRGATEPVHCLNVYNNELISATTANRIGVHTAIDSDIWSFSSTKLRSDTFRGLITSTALLSLNRLILLGADTGNISLLC